MPTEVTGTENCASSPLCLGPPLGRRHINIHKYERFLPRSSEQPRTTDAIHELGAFSRWRRRLQSGSRFALISPSLFFWPTLPQTGGAPLSFCRRRRSVGKRWTAWALGTRGGAMREGGTKIRTRKVTLFTTSRSWEVFYLFYWVLWPFVVFKYFNLFHQGTINTQESSSMDTSVLNYFLKLKDENNGN